MSEPEQNFRRGLDLLQVPLRVAPPACVQVRFAGNLLNWGSLHVPYIQEMSWVPYMGVAQNSTTRATQVLVFVSI